MNMAYTRPIRVFAALKNSQKAPRDFISEDKMEEIIQYDPTNVSASDRHIAVTGIGELILPPDRFSVSIKCRASKDSVQDAKNSVTRRMDYIIQTLRNQSLKEEADYKIYQHLYHVDSMVNVESEIEAHFTDLNKCQSVSNLLAEKLGPGVSVSLPICYHARGSLDKLRRQVGMLAIHNARQKALEMARVIHLSIGRPLQVQELETSENQGASGISEEEPDLSPSIQQRIADTTVSIFSKVSVCFELRPSKSKKSTKLTM